MLISIMFSLAAINIGDAFKLKGGKGIGDVFSPDVGVRGIITALLPTILIIAGLILLFLIVGGGIAYILAAGNTEAQQKSKGVITNAVVGFLLIFGAYWLIQIIEVIFGISILS